MPGKSQTHTDTVLNVLRGTTLNGVSPYVGLFSAAVVTKDHAAGERIRPTIWPTLVLYEGDDLAFDILAVASPDAGSDLTVVIQT